ncbi:ADP-ribosylation [Conidiobolus coronatus NRRL 28638]|uniref:Poly [ADP-ribose] polymerase n=1 Tax=Conidiobolus coronatus (strain ATCC 28846 / CBS 209.66 / NRRL 28638) TaxID=796925 RepID=A0A137NTY9_CONC2|nr:ADP-ribosylation [Conidiobolus coronatus NRRL 28638]|eukprot:KXN66191.1 ADP-ribosylation [Conidiobolus coronatus NRRL 28638]
MIISNSSIHLVKFDIMRGINEYCNYQLLSDAGMIILKSGRIGSEYFHDAFDGGVKMYNQLINNKKEKGFKEIEFEELKSELVVVTYHYNSDKSSGLLVFDCEIVEKFIKDVISKTGHKIKLSIFSDKIPITSSYQTPLGLVSKRVIEKAQFILEQIEGLLEKYGDINQILLNLKRFLLSNKDNADAEYSVLTDNRENIHDYEYIAKQLFDLINEYFSLIPTDIQPDVILNMLLETKVFKFKQQELCNSMLNYYSEIKMIRSARTPDISDNDIIIERVFDSEEFGMVSDLYALNNGSNSNPKIINIYKINFSEHNKRFIKKSNIIGNVQFVWHSTNKRNIASILTKGLLLPESLTGHANDGTFGSGIYFSSSSSKSLTYCNDLLNSEYNTKTTAYLILASVAAGNYFEPDNHEVFSSDEFDSTWAYKDSVSNDILVVYSEDQVKIDYILEIEKD